MPGGDAAGPGLETLHDILLPNPVSWTPRTIGWYVVFGLILFGAARGIGVVLRRFRRNRYRRSALAELRAIERELRCPERRLEALAAIPALLKRTALSAFPRVEVASLTGQAWLAFLDETLGGQAFTAGDGRVLPVLSYAPASQIARLPEHTIEGVVRLARRWISGHASRER